MASNEIDEGYGNTDADKQASVNTASGTLSEQSESGEERMQASKFPEDHGWDPMTELEFEAGAEQSLADKKFKDGAETDVTEEETSQKTPEVSDDERIVQAMADEMWCGLMEVEIRNQKMKKEADRKAEEARVKDFSSSSARG